MNMKKRFSEEQTIQILKEVEAGLAVKELCRKYNISDATVYYLWTTSLLQALLALGSELHTSIRHHSF